MLTVPPPQKPRAPQPQNPGPLHHEIQGCPCTPYLLEGRDPAQGVYFGHPAGQVNIRVWQQGLQVAAVHSQAVDEGDGRTTCCRLCRCKVLHQVRGRRVQFLRMCAQRDGHIS